MKAWIVGPRYDNTHDSYITLVYADTRGQARASLAGHYCSEDEFVYMTAHRCQKMDGKRDKRGICEDDALMIESGEFWMCEEHGRAIDEDRRCPECWDEHTRRLRIQAQDQGGVTHVGGV